MIQPPTHAWSERRLAELADRAWAPRRISPEPRFLCALPPISSPATSSELEAALQAYYTHARRWAPGFEAPWCIPKVTITPLLEGVGRYRIEDGFVFIEMTPQIARNGPAALAVLAHEACHHILDLSGLATHRPEIDEPTTDLAMFICGFGDAFMRGQEALSSISPAWQQAHLGYLTPELYEFSYDWVLRVQHLPNPRPQVTHITTTRLESRNVRAPKPKPWWSRLFPWRSRNERPVDTPAPRAVLLSPQRQVPASSYQLPSAAGMTRKQLLNRLSGDARVLERLLAQERRRQPGASDLALLDAVAEQLNYDRRAPR